MTTKNINKTCELSADCTEIKQLRSHIDSLELMQQAKATSLAFWGSSKFREKKTYRSNYHCHCIVQIRNAHTLRIERHPSLTTPSTQKINVKAWKSNLKSQPTKHAIERNYQT